MSETIGYARVSTASQNLDAQMDALKQAGCTNTFTDKDSGAKSSRPGWDELLAYVRPGDVLVITELSRMTRSLMHLLEIVQELETRKVELKSRHLSLVPPRPCCGLCGNRDGLTQTECCQEWVCDDAHACVMFSYARNSCYHNHGRFTLCGFHSNERHRGDWKTCRRCREAFAPELYVYFGTNEYNFERLDDPPTDEPTYCNVCHKRICLGEESYGTKAGRYVCWTCGEVERSKR